MIFYETNVMVLFISQPESYEYLMIVLKWTFQNSWSYLGWFECEVVQWETHEGGKWWFFLMCMDLLKTILCCNFNFELVTKAWTRQGKHVRNEVKVFLDSNTFLWESVKEQAPNTPKWILIMGVQNVVSISNFWIKVLRINLVQIWPSLDHWKGLENYYNKLASHSQRNKL